MGNVDSQHLSWHTKYKSHLISSQLLNLMCLFCLNEIDIFNASIKIYMTYFQLHFSACWHSYEKLLAVETRVFFTGDIFARLKISLPSRHNRREVRVRGRPGLRINSIVPKIELRQPITLANDVPVVKAPLCFIRLLRVSIKKSSGSVLHAAASDIVAHGRLELISNNKYCSHIHFLENR